jgi:hypothetical protein
VGRGAGLWSEEVQVVKAWWIDGVERFPGETECELSMALTWWRLAAHDGLAASMCIYIWHRSRTIVKHRI